MIWETRFCHFIKFQIDGVLLAKMLKNVFNSLKLAYRVSIANPSTLPIHLNVGSGGILATAPLQKGDP